jgi:hypothetical protein
VHTILRRHCPTELARGEEKGRASESSLEVLGLLDRDGALLTRSASASDTAVRRYRDYVLAEDIFYHT